jgi:large subunit ribosomal protein L10
MLMASKAIIEVKQSLVTEVADKFSSSNSTVVVNYRGLSVSEVTELRTKLREAGVEYKVYKNNIMRRAAESVEIDCLGDHFTGPSAIAFSEDVIAPAKVLYEFTKEHKALEIKGGYIEGKYADFDTIKELAEIPNMEGLLTMLAGAMLQPLKEVAIGLNMFSDLEGDVKPVDASEDAATEEVVEETTEEVKEETAEAAE